MTNNILIDKPLDEIITPEQVENIRQQRQLNNIVKQDRKDFEPIVKDAMRNNNITEFLIKNTNGARVKYISSYSKTVIDEAKLAKELKKLGVNIKKLDIYKTTEVSDQIKILV